MPRARGSGPWPTRVFAAEFRTDRGRPDRSVIGRVSEPVVTGAPGTATGIRAFQQSAGRLHDKPIVSAFMTDQQALDLRSEPSRPPSADASLFGNIPRVLWLAAAATGVLLVVDLATQGYNEYVASLPAGTWLFNVNAEGNLATWWNSTLLLSVAGVALVAAALTGRGPGPSRLSWLGLSAMAALLSIDESIEVHERLGEVGSEWTDSLGTSVPTYAWVLPGAVVAVAGTVCAVLWARSLPRDLRYGLLGSLATYLTGALLVESFNGWALHQGHKAVNALGTRVEEGLEMGACLLALAVLARYVLLERDPESGRATVRLREQ